MNNTVYLVGPITALAAGIITLKYFGFSGKGATIIKFVILGLTMWFFGDLISLYNTWAGITAYPTFSDLFYILGYLSFFISVLLSAQLYSFRLSEIKFVSKISLLILFLMATAAVTYTAVIGYDANVNLIYNLSIISWSVGDLLMFTTSMILLSMVWQYKDGLVKNVWLWFIGASIMNFSADIIYNYNSAAVVNGSLINSFLNCMWIGAYFLFAGYFIEIYYQTKTNIEKIKLQENN
jgi:hypothetical protein